MACEARHAPQAPGPDVRLARTHGPPPVLPTFAYIVALCALCGENTLAVLPAVAGPKSALICGICGSPTLAVLPAAAGPKSAQICAICGSPTLAVLPAAAGP